MGTFKAYFRKEMIESWRQYRYLVLGIGFLIFAILDPVMLKMLPYLLKSQIPPELAGVLSVQFTPLQAAQNYFSELVEMVPLFTILGMMGIFADELREQRLVFPYSKGASAREMVLAKYAHYALFIIIAILAGFMLNWIYVNILFEGENVALASMVFSALLYALFYLFTIAVLFLVSSLVRRGIVAALTVLVGTYLSGLVAGIQSIARWVPYTLTTQANQLGQMDNGIVLTTALIACGYIVILLWFTIRRMKTVEVI